MNRLSKHEWDNFLEGHPESHILQTSEWGELKSDFGWEVERIVEGAIGSQILFQPLPLGFHIGYIPRGPIGSNRLVWQDAGWDRFLSAVDEVCRQRNTVLLKIEPDLWREEQPQGQGVPNGFRASGHAIQPPRTVVVSLKESEEDILARMKSKTRYNTRLARRKEVVVRTSTNIGGFFDLLESTADRADFGIHTRKYYQRAFELFAPKGECRLFVAEYDQHPLASIMVFARGSRSWYFYGASSPKHRDRMPTYLVQWEAMRWARDRGCESYDFWGVPDHDQDVLEDQFLDRGDGLWGVYRFKRGFGGDVKRTVGPWDRVYRPLLYQMYILWVQRTT